MLLPALDLILSSLIIKCYPLVSVGLPTCGGEIKGFFFFFFSCLHTHTQIILPPKETSIPFCYICLDSKCMLYPLFKYYLFISFNLKGFNAIYTT